MTDARMTDWLDQDYGVGDQVVYAAMSGRSVNMVFGEVLDIYQVIYNRDRGRWERVTGEVPTDAHVTTRVRIQPLNSARWEQHYRPWYYVDERTGKRIDPWRNSEAIKVREHVIDTRTGEPITDEQRNRYRGGWRQANPDYVPDEFQKYIRTEFHDWVKECQEEKPKPVTIMITENITRWNEPCAYPIG